MKPVLNQISGQKSNQLSRRESLRADRWYSTAAPDSDSDSESQTMTARAYCAISGIVQRLDGCLRIVLLAEMNGGGVRNIRCRVLGNLFEFHADTYTNLNIPALPNERDLGVIHGLLNLRQVSKIYYS